MARAYSLDLRERAVAAAREEDLTRAEVAQRFGIGEATLYNWLRRWQDEGSLVPRGHGGGGAPVWMKQACGSSRSSLRSRTTARWKSTVRCWWTRLGLRCARAPWIGR